MDEKTYKIRKSTLKDIANAIRKKSGSTDLIPVVDLDDNIKNLKSGGSSVKSVKYLPTEWTGTPVPISGYIESVYLNTNLTIGEVINILNRSGYIRLLDGSEIVIINNYFGGLYAASYVMDNGVPSYRIEYYYYNIETKEELIYTIFQSYDEYEEGFVGWNPNIEYPFNVNIDAQDMEYNGHVLEYDPECQINELIADLVSTTPFVKEEIDDKPIYIVNNTRYKYNKETGWSESDDNYGFMPNTLYVNQLNSNSSVCPNVTKVVLDSIVSYQGGMPFPGAHPSTLMSTYPLLETLEIVTGYVPANYFTDSYFGDGVAMPKNLILGKRIKGIESNAVSSSSIENVYFKGTIDELNSMDNQDDITKGNYNLYVLDENGEYYLVNSEKSE